MNEEMLAQTFNFVDRSL